MSSFSIRSVCFGQHVLDSRRIRSNSPFYHPLLKLIMNHYCLTWIEDWCAENGWTDLFMPRRNEFWAFPPHAVMPLPIPSQVLVTIKQRQGLSVDEKRWRLAAILSTAIAILISYLSQSPMPLVTAFIFCAVVVARLDVDDQ